MNKTTFFTVSDSLVPSYPLFFCSKWGYAAKVWLSKNELKPRVSVGLYRLLFTSSRSYGAIRDVFLCATPKIENEDEVSANTFIFQK